MESSTLFLGVILNREEGGEVEEAGMRWGVIADNAERCQKNPFHILAWGWGINGFERYRYRYIGRIKDLMYRYQPILNEYRRAF